VTAFAVSNMAMFIMAAIRSAGGGVVPAVKMPSIRCAFQSSVSSTSWPSSADVMALAFCDRHVPTRSRLNPSALSADRQAGRELPGSMLLYIMM